MATVEKALVGLLCDRSSIELEGRGGYVRHRIAPDEAAAFIVAATVRHDQVGRG